MCRMGGAPHDPGKDKPVGRHLAVTGISCDHISQAGSPIHPCPIPLGCPVLEPGPLAPHPETRTLATSHVPSGDRCALSLQPAWLTHRTGVENGLQRAHGSPRASPRRPTWNPAAAASPAATAPTDATTLTEEGPAADR